LHHSHQTQSVLPNDTIPNRHVRLHPRTALPTRHKIAKLKEIQENKLVNQKHQITNMWQQDIICILRAQITPFS
jgi:hypothetical protein